MTIGTLPVMLHHIRVFKNNGFLGGEQAKISEQIRDTNESCEELMLFSLLWIITSFRNIEVGEWVILICKKHS